jgi:Na+/H+ antiporter NhaD/arsenite permease-like protein
LELTRHWVGVAALLLFVVAANAGRGLLSIGSAAGIALMGQARGQYTFFTHLRWTPAIALGYGLSIWLHLVINRGVANVLPYTLH